MGLKGRELYHCLSTLVTMEGGVPIEVSSTEELAGRYKHAVGLFDEEDTPTLDELLLRAEGFVEEATDMTDAKKETEQAIDHVSYSVQNVGDPNFSVEDANNADEVLSIFNIDLEELKETVYEFFRRVKAFLVNLWRKASRMLDIMYRNVTRLKREAAELLARCRSIGHSGNVGGIFTAPSVAIVSYMGKANIVAVTEGLQTTLSVYTEAINKSTEAANAYYPKISEIVTAVSRQDTDDARSAAAFATIETLAPKFDYKSEPFTGGYIYQGYATRSRLGFRCGFEIKRLEQYYQGIEPSVPIPTVKELENICVWVMRLCDKIMWGRARYRIIRTTHNTALDTISTLVQNIQRGTIGNIVKTDAVVSQLTRLVTDSITGPFQQLNTTVYRAAVGSMVYATTALKHIESKQ